MIKKVLVVFLAFSVCFSSLAFAIESDDINASEFFSKMQVFIKEYTTNATTGNDDIIRYPLNRLIVKTTTNEPLKDTFGAYDVYEGYDGIHILQYVSQDATNEAYSKLLNENIEYVEYDTWITLENVENINHLADNTTCPCSDNPETALLCMCPESLEPSDSFCDCPPKEDYGNHLSWNSGVVDVDKAFELIAAKNITCQPITVAVIDTGIYVNHNKFDPTRFVLDEDYALYDDLDKYPSNVDWHYHGTHVAGIIYDNTMMNVKICPYRVFTDSATFLPYLTIYSAINAIITSNLEIDVINMSLLKHADIDEALKNKGSFYETLDNAINNNIVLVFAAGNDKCNVIDVTENGITEALPATYEKALVVSATNEENKPDTRYSNFGDTVDVASPGTDIYSTAPWIPSCDHPEQEESGNYYIRRSGTSMAAPLVAALAATLKSINPDATPASIERIIKQSAYVPEDWKENCNGNNYGTGIVNFYNAVQLALKDKTEIVLNSNKKFEITPVGWSDALYYTLDGSEPTPENGIPYTEPLDLSKKAISVIKAASFMGDAQVSETTVYRMTSFKDMKINCGETEKAVSDSYKGKIYWRSDNLAVATVDSEGNITGVSKGQATVVASFESGKRIIFNVTVKEQPYYWIIELFEFWLSLFGIGI